MSTAAWPSRSCRTRAGAPLGGVALEFDPDDRLAEHNKLSMQLLGMMLSTERAAEDAEANLVGGARNRKRYRIRARGAAAGIAEGLETFRRIGELVSEVVERRPTSLVVARIVRPDLARGPVGDEESERAAHHLTK